MANSSIELLDYSSKYAKINSRIDVLVNISWRNGRENRYLFYLVFKSLTHECFKYLCFVLKEKEVDFRQAIIRETIEYLEKSEFSGDIKILDMKINKKEKARLLYSDRQFVIEYYNSLPSLKIPIFLNNKIKEFLSWLLPIN
jgi:hypothetical protein